MQWREVDGDVHYTTLLRRMQLWSRRTTYSIPPTLAHSRPEDVQTPLPHDALLRRGDVCSRPGSAAAEVEKGGVVHFFFVVGGLLGCSAALH